MLSAYGSRAAAAPLVGTALAALGARLQGVTLSTAAVAQQASLRAARVLLPPSRLWTPQPLARAFCTAARSRKEAPCSAPPYPCPQQQQQQQPQASSAGTAAAAEPKPHKTVGKADPADAFIFKAHCRGKREMSEEAKQTAET